ncbi:MAG TPA: CYTH domain-containing protein, partial [Acidimicrobiales bacterium]|nr:CYTH domain-containing protein [Acidimicrobiales bacterium]
MAAPTESEVKLDAGSAFRMPALDDLGEGVEAVALPEARMTATYLDTDDLRLVRAGVTLRHRAERAADGAQVEEWTLKLPAPADGALVVRRELRWPGPDDALPAEADALVRPWRRLAALAPVGRLVQVRSRTQLRGDGRPLLEVDDDVVSVMHGARLEARF